MVKAGMYRSNGGRASSCHCWLELGIGLVLFLVACAAPAVNQPTPQPSSEAEEGEFRSLLGARVDPLAQLRTDKKQYAKGERITFWVQNRTGATIYYPDDYYGLEGYAYDTEIGHWRHVDLGFHEFDPHPFALGPAQNSYDDLAGVRAFGGHGLEFAQTGKIRLAVIGWTNPNSPKGSQIASYTDIEVQ